MNHDEQNGLLHKLASICLGCFLLSLGLLLVWFLFYLAAADWAYRIHSTWFTLSRHDFDLLNYGGMAFVKICAIVFFLFPYLATKWIVRQGHS